jgi:PBP1b-binding outer membrane lipoprotein LpoB
VSAIPFKLTVVVGLALLLASCASETREQLSVEVADLNLSGRLTKEALATLKSIGFDCGPKNPSGQTMSDLECSRTKSPSMSMVTCVSSVYLTLDASKLRVERIDVPRAPACFGGFG